MIFECTWTNSYRGNTRIASGLLVYVLHNSDRDRYEAAVLEVDNSSATGYNPKIQIVPLNNLSITPKKG